MSVQPISSILGKTIALSVLPLTCAVVMANTAQAATVSYTVDLTNPSYALPPNPYISFKNTPNDSNNDSWLETVLKINLDPANGFDVAKFLVEYDGTPQGWTVNIGDSITNNGNDGDSATQYYDAEMQIFNTGLTVYGNDQANEDGIEPLQQVNNFVTDGSTVAFEVRNEYLGWDNNSGISDSLNSPYLYALNGQPDSSDQNQANYDIYAGFNRVIDGSYRNGSGVANVTVCLESSSDPGCFESTSVPEPLTILGSATALGFGTLLKRQQSKKQKKS